MASARVFTTSRDESGRGGVSQRDGSAKWLSYGTDRLWDLLVRKFLYVERLFDCFLFYCCTGLYNPGGLHPMRRIM